MVKKGERRTNPFKERKIFNSTGYTDSGALSRLPLPDPEEGEEEEEGDLGERQMEEVEG